jgi:putative CGCGG family rSAM target protein
MTSAYAGREPVTRTIHDRPWVADLETTKHADDRKLIVAEAVDAVEQTRTGRFVDLVTHERHGHPATYLYEAVQSSSQSIDISDEGRCPCGGYVTRITIDSIERRHATGAFDPTVSSE